MCNLAALYICFPCTLTYWLAGNAVSSLLQSDPSQDESYSADDLDFSVE
jgi:hypothetical protein